MTTPLRQASAATSSPAPDVLARIPPYVAVGLAYLLLSCLTLYPLVADFSSAIPGIQGKHADFAQFYWNVWWFQHAVFHLGQDPYFTNYILYPNTINLAYHTFTPLLNVLALPIYATLGLGTAINSWIIGSLALSGLAMFAFLRHHAVLPGLAFLGGVLFAFTASNMSRVSFVHLSMVAIGWLPVSLLAWDRLTERRTWRSAVVLGGVLYATLLTDIQFVVWLAVLLPFYALSGLIRVGKHERMRVVALGVLAVLVLIGLSLIAPLPQLVAGLNAEYGQEYPGLIEDWYSIHLSDLIALPPRHLVSERATLGVLLPLLVAVGLLAGQRTARRRFWLIAGTAFLILSLGPTLKPFNIPLPYRVLHEAFGGTYRVAARFLLPAVFALIVFATLSFTPKFRQLAALSRTMILAGALMFVALEGRWYEPFPVFRMPDYRIYHAIGRTPGEFLVLEVPVGPHNLFRGVFGRGGVLQFYAPIHHKRLINGAVSRAPLNLTQSYRQWPLITALAEEGPVPDVQVARDEFQRLSREWDIRYVLIHRDLLSPDIATWAAGFFNTQDGWCLVDEEGPILAYAQTASGNCFASDRFAAPPDGTVDLGNPGDERYLGLGWYGGESIGGPQARWTGRTSSAALRVYLSRQNYRVSIRATSFLPDQTVTVYANEARVAELRTGQGLNEYTIDVPAEAISPESVTRLTFAHARAESPSNLTGDPNQDRRQLAVAYDSITWVAVTSP